MAPPDLIVIGAGPAGSSAALAASRAGLQVVLIDEAEAPGGQVYRAPPNGWRLASGKVGPDQEIGERLRAEVAAATIDWRGGARVWSVSGRFRVDLVGPAGSECIEAPRLVAATGAHERVIPFPGWTLPGVIGLAGATILLKSQGMLPGRRTLVAGCGPLLAAVASKIVEGGGTVAAIADLAGPGEWLAASPKFASRPALLRQGLGWALTLGRARVPVHFRHTVAAANGEGCLARVALRPVAADGSDAPGREIAYEADALAVGHGLVPGAEVTRLLRAEQAFRPGSGGWVPVLDEVGRSSIAGLYAAGDGARFAGAVPAALGGRLAGLAAAHDAGAMGAQAFEREARAIAAERAKADAFATAVAKLMRPRPGLVDAIAPETIVCRCEDVSRAEIDAAAGAGAREVNQLKHFTRCGMGPCQGRMCGEIAAELLARHAGNRQAVGQWTMRPPLRPVPLQDLLGRFDYADIPVPQPAPL